MTERALVLVEKVAGHAPETCPWQAFHHPLMSEILDLWGAVQSGMGALLISALDEDPPAVVWEGLQLYARASGRVRAHHDDLVEQYR